MDAEANSSSGERVSRPTDNAASPAPKRRSPLLAAITVIICVAAIAVLRVVADRFDFAVVNVVTLLLAFTAVMTVVVHILRRRDLPRLVRWAPLVLLVIGAVVASRILKVERVSGRLVPRLAFRWTPKPDELMAMPVIGGERITVDLATTSPGDFPGFLGPGRDLHVPGIRLDRDWRSHPPRLLWRRPIGAGWSSFSVVNGFAVTMEQRGAHELVTCYEATTGKPCWSQSIEARHETVLGGVGPRCTPMIHGGKVYALGATGVLRCLDGATGTLIWSDDILARYGVTPKQDLLAVAWGRSASPLIVDQTVVVPFGGPKGGPFGALAAYQCDSGALVWQNGDRQVSYSSPVLTELCGIRQIVIVNEDTVSGHVAGTGETLWSYPWPGGSASNASVSQAVPVPGDRVFLSKGYGGGAMLLHLTPDDRGGIACQVVWKNRRVLKTKFTNVVVDGPFVYGLSDGILECVDLNTGESKWKDRRHANFGHGQILLAGDVLLVQAESGEVAMVEPRPDAYRELGRFEALTDQTWNNLCLYGPYLLVRNATEAACYQLPLAGAAPPTAAAASPDMTKAKNE